MRGLEARRRWTVPLLRCRRAVGGVREVAYGRSGLLVRLEGGTYRHVPRPVGFVELRGVVNGQRMVERLHSFTRNDAEVVATRKPSAAAAAGEAGFWRVLHGTDRSEATQQATIT